MATDGLTARLEEFRAEYRKSLETGRALAAQLAPSGDPAAWLRLRPAGVLAAARREQARLARELDAEIPGGGRAPVRPAVGGARSAAITPDDFAFRTMGR
jgi:hypothetical protein